MGISVTSDRAKSLCKSRLKEYNLYHPGTLFLIIIIEVITSNQPSFLLTSTDRRAMFPGPTNHVSTNLSLLFMVSVNTPAYNYLSRMPDLTWFFSERGCNLVNESAYRTFTCYIHASFVACHHIAIGVYESVFISQVAPHTQTYNSLFISHFNMWSEYGNVHQLRCGRIYYSCYWEFPVATELFCIECQGNHQH